MNNSRGSCKPNTVQERIERAVGGLYEKVHRLDIPEEKKQAVLDNFDWLLRKRLEYQDCQRAGLFDDQIYHLLNLVDSLSSSRDTVTPVARGESTADLSSRGPVANKTQITHTPAANQAFLSTSEAKPCEEHEMM